jgi:hypothetical protein
LTLTLRGDVGSPGELAGSVSAAIIKLGAGTWTLSGANSGVSATVEAGTLAVNYDTSNTRKLSGALALGNGTLAFTGASGTQIEYATSTTLDGTAAITRSGGNSVTIELGPISRQSGSSLEVSGDGIVTTNNLNSSGICPAFS